MEEKKLTDEKIAKEKSKEYIIRDKYCIRIQKAFENMRCGCDCEDIPSILLDFEKVIKAEQTAEIERLMEENATLKKKNFEYEVKICKLDFRNRSDYDVL